MDRKSCCLRRKLSVILGLTLIFWVPFWESLVWAYGVKLVSEPGLVKPSPAAWTLNSLRIQAFRLLLITGSPRMCQIDWAPKDYQSPTHRSISTYMPTYITYLPRTYLPTYVHTYMRTYTHTVTQLHSTYEHVCMHAYMHSHTYTDRPYLHTCSMHVIICARRLTVHIREAISTAPIPACPCPTRPTWS